MLRQALCKTTYKKTPEKAIILPKQQTVEEIKKNDTTTRSSDNLAEMCNFDNDPISCTPPMDILCIIFDYAWRRFDFNMF